MTIDFSTTIRPLSMLNQTITIKWWCHKATFPTIKIMKDLGELSNSIIIMQYRIKASNKLAGLVQLPSRLEWWTAPRAAPSIKPLLPLESPLVSHKLPSSCFKVPIQMLNQSVSVPRLPHKMQSCYWKHKKTHFWMVGAAKRIWSSTLIMQTNPEVLGALESGVATYWSSHWCLSSRRAKEETSA